MYICSALLDWYTIELFVGILLRYHLQRWQDRVGAYTDFAGQTHDYEPYVLVDTKLTWTEAKWKAYIEANNLLDTSYHDYGLVEQPGRWLIAGINIEF